MDCFILGSGGMMPMPGRALASAALRTGGAVYLFDCGEGTQVPYKALHVGQRPLRLVAITHLHADHCLGLPGMLMLRAQMPDPAPLTVLGPPGLRRLLHHLRQDLPMYINYPIEVRQWQPDGPELAYEDEQVQVRWRQLDHSELCLGYRLQERPRPGRFFPERAQQLGVPQGPLWGELQRGQAVVTPAGQRVLPEQVLGPARRGRHVAYVTDTAPCPALDPLLREVDLALLEGMFLPRHEEEGRLKKHLTVAQACSAAQQAGARQVVLLHVITRYDAADLQEMDAVAARLHPAARVARDRELLGVPAPDEGA